MTIIKQFISEKSQDITAWQTENISDEKMLTIMDEWLQDNNSDIAKDELMSQLIEAWGINIFGHKSIKKEISKAKKLTNPILRLSQDSFGGGEYYGRATIEDKDLEDWFDYSVK